MNDYAQEYASDASELGDNILAAISQKARDMVTARERVTECEEKLRQAQLALKDISEREMPELMAAAGQTEVKTQDGIRVIIKEVLRASIPSDRVVKALSWLEDRGHGSVIKHEIKVDFGKGQDDKAEELSKAALKMGVVPSEKRTVHPQTLQALLRELLAEGIDVPLELFGAFVQKQTDLK